MFEKINCKLLISGLKFPEGPCFDHYGNLWFVEIKGGNLSCWDGQNLKRFDVDGTPNGVMIDRQGHVWFCDSERGEIRTYNPKTEEFNTICCETIDGEKLKRPNDLIFDKCGNLIFSDHADGRTEFISTFCVLPKNSDKAKVISSGKLFTNGLAFCNNGSTLLLAETYNQQLWIGEWDAEKLELLNERPFAKAGNGPWGPDGIAFDENENLYVTVFNEHLINVYNKNGVLIDKILTIGSRPTSCAFDQSGKIGLVVTEAERGEILSFPELGKGLPIFNG
jgi:gluconolactonase